MSINSSDHIKTSKPDESNVQYLQSQMASQTAINLDPKLISGWLDQNPQFLAEYLRKQQSQRRNNIINDETSQLLSNFYANLRLQTNNFSTSLHGTSGSHAFSNTQSTQLATQFLGDNDQFLTDSRKKFKELTLYEKMYALVKALYQSLDLKTTCRKILKTVSLLLDADRCSLFLVVDDEHNETKKALLSIVFDAQSLSQHNQQTTVKTTDDETCDADQSNTDCEQIKIPYGVGIVGHVALTGLPLNIENAYEDERFNSSIDKKTGYKTKSILCLPILNEFGECVAVAQAINKLNENDDDIISFSSKDEETFWKFMPFISIAIRNSNLYTKSRKEAFINKILLELATLVFDEQTSVDKMISKIIFHALLLLECEYCQIILLNNKSSKAKQTNKLFDRVYELNHAELKSDTYSNSATSVKPVSQHSTRYPIDIKIVNTIIQTKEIQNLNSMLGIPVTNSSNQVVALIFACNKIQTDSFDHFSPYDINAAKAFALFCGIGIQNIIIYEKVVRAMNMQQVALDVLSYHASSKSDEVELLLSEHVPETIDLDLHLFSFDEQTLDDMSTLKACISMFIDLELLDKFDIPYQTLCQFFLTVKKNYRPVAYHNWRHGFNVMTSMYTILTQGQFKNSFSDLEILSLLIAAICHDVDHRGTTNTFQIKIQSPLAKLYSTSVMEHHHFNQCIMILHNNVNNILINLSSSEYSTAMEIIEKCILATDLSLHLSKIASFIDKSNSANNNRFDSAEDKELLISMLMTGCDLSGSTKPWNCHYRLANLVASEFFEQGDLEKEKFHNEPIDIMNRNKKDQLPQMQIQFLQSVCIPLYQSLYLSNPLLKPLIDGCETNVENWKKLAKAT